MHIAIASYPSNIRHNDIGNDVSSQDISRPAISGGVASTWIRQTKKACSWFAQDLRELSLRLCVLGWIS